MIRIEPLTKTYQNGVYFSSLLLAFDAERCGQHQDGTDLAGETDISSNVEAMRLSGKEARLPYELSGKSSSVCRLRALSKHSQVLFCDEPSRRKRCGRHVGADQLGGGAVVFPSAKTSQYAHTTCHRF